MRIFQRAIVANMLRVSWVSVQPGNGNSGRQVFPQVYGRYRPEARQSGMGIAHGLWRICRTVQHPYYHAPQSM